MVQPLWKTVWRLLKKLKLELPYKIQQFHFWEVEMKTLTGKDICTPMFTAASFIIAKT